jgi:hypothetical protein
VGYFTSTGPDELQASVKLIQPSMAATINIRFAIIIIVISRH